MSLVACLVVYWILCGFGLDVVLWVVRLRIYDYMLVSYLGFVICLGLIFVVCLLVVLRVIFVYTCCCLLLSVCFVVVFNWLLVAFWFCWIRVVCMFVSWLWLDGGFALLLIVLLYMILYGLCLLIVCLDLACLFSVFGLDWLLFGVYCVVSSVV